MFVKIDRLFARMRGEHAANDRGASLIVVLGLMAFGFVVASVIAAACLFSIRQTSRGQANVEAFAAAEAGRDVVVASLSENLDGCTDPHYPLGSGTAAALDYDVTVYAVETATPPTSAAGLTAACPTEDSTFIVISSTGEGTRTGSVTVDSVYTTAIFEDRVAGGGLGFIDQSYTTAGVSYDGDVIVRRGDFTCGGAFGAPTRINGSVYVLSGHVRVPTDILGNGADCEISGDVVTSGEVQLGSCFFIFCFGANLEVGGRVKAGGAVSVRGTLAAGGNIDSGAAISVLNTSGSSITSATGGISAVGSISAAAGTIDAALALATNGSVSGAGTIEGGSISARTGISSTGTVRATAGAITSGGAIAGVAVSATGDITAAGNISSTSGSSVIRSTGGRVLATGNISVSNASGLVQANGLIAAGGTMSLTGDITAASVTAVGTITSAGDCTVTGDLTSAALVSFSQRGATAPQCRIQGTIRARGTGQSTLPQHSTGSPSQVYTKDAQARGTWASNGKYRDLDGTPVNVDKAGVGNNTTIVAPTAPVVPAATMVTYSPIDATDTYRSLAELGLRTQWIDLGATTRWNGYTERVTLAGGTCSRTAVVGALNTNAAPVVIDATACGNLNLSGLGAITLARDAVLLVNEVRILFARFTGTHLTPPADCGVELPTGQLCPRQLFIVQVDDNLAQRPPATAPTAPAEPQPDCAGRNDISVTGTGFTWDPNVRVLLYSPCGSSAVNALSSWVGHLYVAKDETQDSSGSLNIFTNLQCERMWVTGTLDLPCSVNDYGEWSGTHTEDFARIGELIHQTEP